ncbi:MAG TPA: hypothetical protein VJK28_03765 [Nitrospiria bacterium]|nr:hypothetical protein [Nitrospiria bacterium]
MIIRSLSLSIVLSCLFLISGCAYDENKEVSTCIEEGEASGTIAVNISCGDPKTTPLYFWDGADAFVVEVARTSDLDHVVWQVTSTLPNMDGIQSPVIHGERPANAAITVDEETQLTVGIEYLVKVSRISGESGSRKFTIQP